MLRDVSLYLQDIETACKKIIAYTEGVPKIVFFQGDMVFDATIRNLEVIGEAIKQIPASFRVKYPNVEWRKIAGLRDIVIHHYFGIDSDIIWDVIQNKIPELLIQIQLMLANESSNSE